MKHLFVFFLLIGLSTALWAQDVIIRKDGTEVKSKVLEVTPDQVRYQRFDNLDGPVYSEKKDQILKIKYANGSEDIFVKENKPPATVQNQIVWQSATPAKKVRKVRYSGSVEAMPYIGFYNWGLEYDMYDDPAAGLCISTTHGVQLFDKYFLGMGIGANIERNHIYVPVYFNFRLDLSKEQVARPFLSFSLGMQFGSFDDSDYDTYYTYGLWSNALVGYQFNSKLYIAVGLTLQNAVYDSGYYYDFGGWSYHNGYNEEIYGSLGMIASMGFKF